MNKFATTEFKLKHPYFKLMELRGNDLKKELNSWNRDELINWLSWNDSNGIYKDEDSLMEFGNTVDKEEAIEIITRQITGE